MKKLIRNKLRESLFDGIIHEEDEDDNKDVNNDHKTSKWYTDVQNALDKDKNPTAPSQVGVMKAMGIADDKKGVNRSLWGKKLRREKNDDGSVYEFTFDELAEIRANLGMT